jgi:lysophosphatidic acid acyltransferase/lysophosphatidylinositol acyltransferase
MKFDRKLLNTIQSLLPVQIALGYCFIVSGLIINFVQLLTWIFIWPFSKQLYRQINYFLGTLLWSRKCRQMNWNEMIIFL